MSSISSSASSLSNLSAKTGIGGLVSGMDIDELVSNLTQTSKNKILKQQQTVQKLEWKQTAYRSVTTGLKSFQSSYLDVLSATNMRSGSFFNTLTASSSSSAVTAASTAFATSGTMVINSVTQLATAQTVQSKDPVSKALSGKMLSAEAGVMTESDITDLLSQISGKSISVNLDGKVRAITFDSDFVDSVNSNLTTNGLQTAFQSAIDDAFGFTDASDRVINVSVTEDQLSLTASGSRITLNAVGEDTTTLAALGFSNEQSNLLSTSSTLGDLSLGTELTGGTGGYKFTINSTTFEFSSTDTFSSVINKINSSDAGVSISYSSISDKFTMTAKETGSGDNIVISETSGNLLTALGLNGSGATETAGKNAVFSVNGQQIIRSSNEVTIDGVKLGLKETTDTASTITLTTDPKDLVSSIKNFVEDYNKMIDNINSLVKEDYDSRYQPLSDEQKDEMSDSEIEKWEKKAKAGLLRNDSTLRSISSKLQSVMTGVSINGTSLYTMGITSAGYSENGKLKIDEDKLTTALKKHPNEISELFTSEDGIGNQLNDIINGAVKTSGARGSRGTLVELAGVESTTSATENSIFDQIGKANDTIDILQDRLTDEESRLWRKFTAMEQALQQLNSQSSILTQFTSS